MPLFKAGKRNCTQRDYPSGIGFDQTRVCTVSMRCSTEAGLGSGHFRRVGFPVFHERPHLVVRYW